MVYRLHTPTTVGALNLRMLSDSISTLLTNVKRSKRTFCANYLATNETPLAQFGSSENVPPTEVVAGIERPLAMCHVDVDIQGTSAYAGKAPNEGNNAMQRSEQLSETSTRSRAIPMG